MKILNTSVVLKNITDMSDTMQTYIDSNICNLEFDIFFVERVANESLLNVMFQSIFRREDFYDSLDIDPLTCSHFA